MILMAEVHASFEELAHVEDGKHVTSCSGWILRGAFEAGRPAHRSTGRVFSPAGAMAPRV
jgi:hypothetical protein